MQMEATLGMSGNCLLNSTVLRANSVTEVTESLHDRVVRSMAE